MNLRWVIVIYNCNGKYLYEIIEDYKEAETPEEKDEIFNSFCSSIWSSNNHRRKYIKTIHFNVRKDLLETELGKVFDTWSSVEYTYYKSMTKEQNWCSLIRQKINNIYTRYFDKDVILGKSYMDLLKKPKELYYDWISETEMDANTVTIIIDNAIADSIKEKERLQREKMELSWDEYKKVVNEFLHKCFDNSKLIEDYEDKTSIPSMYDFFTEDHFYVKYFNRCLDGFTRNFEKKQSGIYRPSKRNIEHGYKIFRCNSCGKLARKTGKNQKYCTDCKMQIHKEQDRKYHQAKRNRLL